MPCDSLHRQVRHDLLVESQKHRATELLRQIPSIGPIRAALLVALIQTPHRFRTKRQLWAYSGLNSLTVPLCTSMSSVKRERVATVREGGPFFASPSAYPCLP
jgi:transposase IS116/IS110/IS902 family protein